MKQIWLFSVRTYIRAGLFFYLKKIKIIDGHFIPINKPVLLLPNHQNALLDALLIATQTKRSAYFLTRAGAFNKPIVASILKSLNMLPVYRIRVGKRYLKIILFLKHAVNYYFKINVSLFSPKEAIISIEP
jgi:1-acyl-sn-glycerol-3-phosphate acyltransferase